MAQTPFTYPGTPYGGQGMPRVVDTVGTFNRFWLGKPGYMVQLPSPQNGYMGPRSFGESETTLLNGRVAVHRKVLSRRYALVWPMLSGRDWGIVDGFHRRAFGYGPWCFVHPGDRNRLVASASMCGALNGDVSKWAATAGTITYDSTITAPILPSGVLRWSGAGNGSRLTVGKVVSGVLTPDVSTSTSTGTAVPYLPAEPVSMTLWARTASGTASVNLQAAGRLADGTTTVDLSASTTTLSTTWQPLYLSTMAGGLGAALYALEALKCNTTSAPDILVANAQVEYEPMPTDWTLGAHVPRVVCVAGTDPQLDLRLKIQATLTLAES